MIRKIAHAQGREAAYYSTEIGTEPNHRRSDYIQKGTDETEVADIKAKYVALVSEVISALTQTIKKMREIGEFQAGGLDTRETVTHNDSAEVTVFPYGDEDGDHSVLGCVGGMSAGLVAVDVSACRVQPTQPEHCAHLAHGPGRVGSLRAS